MAAEKTPRDHRDAVTRLLRSTGLLHVPEEAPLVALVKTLAKEMDEGGGTRTSAAYLSALKDVRRVLNGATRRIGGSAEVEPPREEVVEVAEVPNDLAAFKQLRGIA